MGIGKAEALLQRIRGPIEITRLKHAGVHIGAGVTIVGTPIVSTADRGSIKIGERSVLVSRAAWTALGVSRPVILRSLLPGARIAIGSDVGMSGTTVCAARSVTIGDRVLLGPDAVIVDTDFHPVDELPRRHLPIPPPVADDEVVIGPDAFIGARSIILKGSTVGAGAVIGAGSVVSGVVPARAVFAGAPARFIRWVGAAGDDERTGQ